MNIIIIDYCGHMPVCVIRTRVTYSRSINTVNTVPKHTILLLGEFMDTKMFMGVINLI